jgi:hypothetical protein
LAAKRKINRVSAAKQLIGIMETLNGLATEANCPSRECEGQEECTQHEYFKATWLACFCQSLGCFASSRDRKGPEPSVIPRQALI